MPPSIAALRSAFTRECYEDGMRLVLLLALVACGASQAPAESDPSEPCAPNPATGSSALYTPVDHEGVRSLPAEACAEGHYIRVERAQGSRAIVMGRAEGGLAGCETPEPECERIQADALFAAVHDVLQAEGIQTIGIGLGPCGDLEGDYDAWRFSLALHDWAHVNRAVEVMGEMLRQWDIQGHVGVAVRDIPCATLLEAR